MGLFSLASRVWVFWARRLACLRCLCFGELPSLRLDAGRLELKLARAVRVLIELSAPQVLLSINLRTSAARERARWQGIHS